MGGLLVMNQAERDRLCVIRAVSESRISRRQAAERLGVKPRQVRRLVEKYGERGDAIAIHGLKGVEGNRGKRREPCVRELVSALFREYYADYGPTLFAETLSERHWLEIPRETVRRWLAGSGVREPKRARRKRHPRREPRPRRGGLAADTEAPRSRSAARAMARLPSWVRPMRRAKSTAVSTRATRASRTWT